MKKFLSLIIMCWLLASCGPSPTYVVNSTQAQPMQPVVVQQQVDPYQGANYQVLSNGGSQEVYVTNGTEQFFMDYILFSRLYSSGGWGSVYYQYRAHPSVYYSPAMYNRYHSWKRNDNYTRRLKSISPRGTTNSIYNKPTAPSASNTVSANKPSGTGTTNSIYNKPTAPVASQPTVSTVNKPVASGTSNSVYNKPAAPPAAPIVRSSPSSSPYKASVSSSSPYRRK